MRARDAWLAALAATLGISEEACRAKDTAPAAAREVPSASASASASIVESVAPSASASAETAPSATASVVASASAAPKASAGATEEMLKLGIQAACGGPSVNTIGTGRIGTGIGIPNQSCGATVNDMRRSEPRAEVNVTLNGGATGDERVVQSLRPRLRNCANQALVQDPTQRGRLTILAVIGPNGAVSSAGISNNTGLSTASAECMVRAVRNAQFPAVMQHTLQIVIDQTTSP